MYVHSIDNNHSFDLKNSSLIAPCTDLQTRKILESSLIRHHSDNVVNLNPGLNIIDPFLSSLLLRSYNTKLLNPNGNWT